MHISVKPAPARSRHNTLWLYMSFTIYSACAVQVTGLPFASKDHQGSKLAKYINLHNSLADSLFITLYVTNLRLRYYRG